MQHLEELPLARQMHFLRWVQPRIDPESFYGSDQVGAMVTAVLRLADQGAARARQLAPLARALLPQYTCNVDDRLKAKLKELAATGTTQP